MRLSGPYLHGLVNLNPYLIQQPFSFSAWILLREAPRIGCPASAQRQHCGRHGVNFDIHWACLIARTGNFAMEEEEGSVSRSSGRQAGSHSPVSPFPCSCVAQTALTVMAHQCDAMA